MSIEETCTGEQNLDEEEAALDAELLHRKVAAALDEELLRRKVAGYTPDQVQAVILAAEKLSDEVEDLLFAVVDERAQRQKVRDAWQAYVETADRS